MTQLFSPLSHPLPLTEAATHLLERIHRVKRPPAWELSASDVRANYERTAGILDIRPLPVHDLLDIEIPVAEGVIRARVYWGEGSMQRLHAPSLVFSHGGGFTIGSVNTYDAVCRRLANGIQGIVLSLDYRLAPEYRFPTAADDVFHATRWWLEVAPQYGADPTFCFTMGDSAGGTLTAQTAIRLRDAGHTLAGQILVYPGTCAWQDTPSHQAYAQGYLLDQRMIQWMFAQYLVDDTQRTDWRFAPLLCPDVQDLAPCFVQLASCDPLVDEGIAYANRLQEQGNRVDLRVYQGMIHGFYNMGAALPDALQAHQDTIDWINQRYDLMN